MNQIKGSTEAVRSLPVLVEHTGNIRVFEIRGELCMSQDDLGTILGFSDPSHSISNLYQRHKDELEEWRFSHQTDAKTSGGRPAVFYYVYVRPYPHRKRGPDFNSSNY